LLQVLDVVSHTQPATQVPCSYILSERCF